MKILLSHLLHEIKRGGGLKAQMLRGGIGAATIQFSSRILSLLLSIVLARFLGLSGYGIYTYANAILILLTVIAVAGTPALLMREVAATQAHGEWGLLRGVIKRARQFAGISAVIVTVIGLLVLRLMSGNLDQAVVYTNIFMLLAIPFAALSNTAAHILMGLQRVIIGQVISVLLRPSLLLLSIVIVFVFWPETRLPQNVMAIQLISSVLVFLIAMAFVRNCLPHEVWRYEPSFRNQRWFASTLSFTLIGGAMIINNQADIIMLGWFRSVQEVGLYRVATQGALLVAFGLQVVNSVVAPQFARLYSQGDMQRLQRLLTASARIILILSVPIAVAFILAGGAIAGWMFGQEFHNVHLPIAILAFGQLINVMFGSVANLLNMTGHEKISARYMWQTTGLNILLNLLLIPPLGMVGAAVATVMSLVLWNFLLFLAVRRHLQLNPTAF